VIGQDRQSEDHKGQLIFLSFQVVHGLQRLLQQQNDPDQSSSRAEEIWQGHFQNAACIDFFDTVLKLKKSDGGNSNILRRVLPESLQNPGRAFFYQIYADIGIKQIMHQKDALFCMPG